MLEGRQALDLAIDLARMPTLAEAMRAHPLPPHTLVVIRIAAGCPDTRREAERVTGLNATVINEACAFYLQQVLLAPNADSYRVLGVRPEASRKEMREHMRWLMKWLHPDGNRDEWESVFAERVLKAWRDAEAKNDPHGRVRHGRSAPVRSRTAARRAQRPVQRWIALPLESSTPLTRRRRLIAAAALVGMLGLGIALMPAFAPWQRLLSAWQSADFEQAEGTVQN